MRNRKEINFDQIHLAKNTQYLEEEKQKLMMQTQIEALAIEAKENGLALTQYFLEMALDSISAEPIQNDLIKKFSR